MDGTLADSLSVLSQVYFRFLEKFGRRGSDAEFAALNGPSLAEIVTQLRVLHELPGTTADLVSAYDQLLDEAYLKVLPMPGARQLLEIATERGWTLTLVTSNLGKRSQAWLAEVGFSSFFHFIVSGEEVQRGKPWPDLYELALSRSGCSVAHSLAVEDSYQGAMAALAAGLQTLVIGLESHSVDGWPPGVKPIRDLKSLLEWL